MKTISFLVVLSILFIACHKSESVVDVQPAQAFQKNSIDTLQQIIQQSIRTTGSFEWKQLPSSLLWQAISKSKGYVSVGYQLPDVPFREATIDAIQLEEPDWSGVLSTLVALLLQSEREVNPGLQESDLVLWDERVLPVCNVVLKNPRSLTLLLQSRMVRYVEPMEYDANLFSSYSDRQSGCGANLPDRSLVPGVHYGVITPQAKASWNYPDHGILDAWHYVSGKGVKVFLIDTGVSYAQENLGTAFNQGFSMSRTLERIVTLPRQRFLGIINTGPPETPEDGCGHGTAMAGVLAAPRGVDGNIAGIAYNSNLITCRASTDVFIDEAREVKGVSDAFTTAAQKADVRIISMSLGRITVSSQIRDAIQYAHAKGKLIFCAAGTSFSFTSGWAGVIFPASLPEVQAVTGVQQLSNFTACENCHSGPEVDFVVVMERVGDHKAPLTVSDRGDEPSTIGGSSVATASMAAMAALVWSRYPYYSRDQILIQLERYSSFYPLRHARWGWGKFQPALAVD
jgi:subtilisin family serine protease